MTLALAVLTLSLDLRMARADIPPEDLARIRAAIPTEPSVRVFRPRNVLIFTLCKGYRHSSIPHGVAALKLMGEMTGAYIAEASDDVSVFRKENLDRFEGIIFLSSTGTLFEDETLRANLLNFVRNGKGVVGIHAATDCFYDWSEYGEMMGGYFDGHPWNANSTVTLKIEEPDHPVCSAFGGEPFTVTDEIYQFRDPYSRSKLRVLTSIDTSKTDMRKPGIRRADGDFAVSWVRNYGKGRVFYSSLGHREDIYWNKTVLKHYLDGIQFALGDLQADAKPRPEQINGDKPHGITPAPVSDALTEAAEYEFGQSRSPLSVVADYVYEIEDNTVAREAMERNLLGLLEADSTTNSGRLFICRQLALIGGDQSVSALAKLLRGDPESAEMARYALERIPGDKADAAFLEALEYTEGETRIGIINSIGKRRMRGAVRRFHQTWTQETPIEVSIAQGDAYAEIGGEKEADAVRSLVAWSELYQRPEVRRAAINALIKISEDLIERDNSVDALWIFEWMLGNESEMHVRVAGLRGIAVVNPERALGTIVQLLNDDSSERWQHIAASILAQMDDASLAPILAKKYTELISERARVLFLEALGERGEVDATAFVRSVASDEMSLVSARIAAIKALGNLGDGQTPALLAQIAADEEDWLRDPARASLYALRKPSAAKINEVIQGLCIRRSGSTAVHAELIRALGRRRATRYGRIVVMALLDATSLVRDAAWGAAGRIADGGDSDFMILRMPGVSRPLVVRDTSEIDTATAAILALCDRLGPSGLNKVNREVIAALVDADAAAQVGLLPILSRVGAAEGLRAVVSIYGDVRSDVVRSAAVGAMANWPDASAADALLAVVRETENAELGAIAFVGFVKIITGDAQLPAQSAVALYAGLLTEAQNDEEIALALKGIAELAHVEAIELAETYLASASLRSAAAQTMLSIASEIARDDRTSAKRAIATVLAVAGDDSSILSKAGATLSSIEREDDFIRVWVFAGPYAAENVGGGELFDMAFPPEPGYVGAGDITWRRVGDDALIDPGFVDLLKLYPKSNCCGYLKTRIWTPSATKASLEIGSDDGVKIWLNGAIVHANNVMRGISRAQDTLTVQLDKGWNTLLMKITQGGGDWRAACRIRDANGFHIERIRFAAQR